MQNTVAYLIACMVLGGCAYTDPELDREIEQYRGTGIQQQGNTLPPHELDDVED